MMFFLQIASMNVMWPMPIESHRRP